VGIGTDNPTSILDIHGSQNWDGMTKLRLLNPASEYGRTHLQLVGRYENNNDIWSMSNGRNSIIFSTQTSKDATIVDTNTIQARNGNLGIFTSGYSTSSPALVLNSTGNVGIGTDNPTQKLDVAGNIRCTTLYQTSDKRLKNNIQNLNSVLDLINGVNPVSFNTENDDKTKYGFIAQELENIIPDIVNSPNDDDDYYCVDYVSMIPLLTKSTQELHKIIMEQENRIMEQQNQIDMLKEILARNGIV
jgi:hypothetical protein